MLNIYNIIHNINIQKKQVYINTIRKRFFSMRKDGNIEIKEFKFEKLKSNIFIRYITDIPDIQKQRIPLALDCGSTYCFH